MAEEQPISLLDMAPNKKNMESLAVTSITKDRKDYDDNKGIFMERSYNIMLFIFVDRSYLIIISYIYAQHPENTFFSKA